jgi:hypothetical protein
MSLIPFHRWHDDLTFKNIAGLFATAVFFPSGTITTVKNVMAEWSALLLRVRKIPDSNLDPEPRYPDRFFVSFLPPTQMPR